MPSQIELNLNSSKLQAVIEKFKNDNFAEAVHAASILDEADFVANRKTSDNTKYLAQGMAKIVGIPVMVLNSVFNND